jgi:hypothetical protein
LRGRQWNNEYPAGLHGPREPHGTMTEPAPETHGRQQRDPVRQAVAVRMRRFKRGGGCL